MHIKVVFTRSPAAVLCFMTISSVILSCGPKMSQTESPRKEASDAQMSSRSGSAAEGHRRNTPLGAETEQAIVESHNRFRAKHCAPPLKWSKRIASTAQSWANKLKKRGCSLVHSGNPSLGENIFFGGPPGAIDLKTAVDAWYEEIENFNFKSPGFSTDTGHFTQVVWRDTVEIGCGAAVCPEGDILVCNYSPGGNVQGQYKDNVSRATTCAKKYK